VYPGQLLDVDRAKVKVFENVIVVNYQGYTSAYGPKLYNHIDPCRYIKSRKKVTFSEFELFMTVLPTIVNYGCEKKQNKRRSNDKNCKVDPQLKLF
jgi:hypothetical protein